MNVLSCPYCDKAQASPPPSSAGQYFRCPFCQQKFRFSGVAGIAIPQSATQQLTVPPMQLNAASPDGLKMGTALLISLVAAIALLSEIGISFIFGIGAAFSGPSWTGLSVFGSIFGTVILMTLAIGILAPVCSLIEMLTKKPNISFKIMLPLLGLLLVACGLNGWFSAQQAARIDREEAAAQRNMSAAMASLTPAPTATPRLQLVESHIEQRAPGERYVVGTIMNASSTPCKTASVLINLYDAAGNMVGSVTDDGANLYPGDKWKFAAQIYDDAVVRVIVKEVSGE